jgi:hypothetical protein
LKISFSQGNNFCKIYRSKFHVSKKIGGRQSLIENQNNKVAKNLSSSAFVKAAGQWKTLNRSKGTFYDAKPTSTQLFLFLVGRSMALSGRHTSPESAV